MADEKTTDPNEHRRTWHYAVPRGPNQGQERCDYFGSDCPHFLHDDHAGDETPRDADRHKRGAEFK